MNEAQERNINLFVFLNPTLPYTYDLIVLVEENRKNEGVYFVQYVQNMLLEIFLGITWKIERVIEVLDYLSKNKIYLAKRLNKYVIKEYTDKCCYRRSFGKYLLLLLYEL